MFLVERSNNYEIESDLIFWTRVYNFIPTRIHMFCHWWRLNIQPVYLLFISQNSGVWYKIWLKVWKSSAISFLLFWNSGIFATKVIFPSLIRMCWWMCSWDNTVKIFQIYDVSIIQLYMYILYNWIQFNVKISDVLRRNEQN